MSDIRVFSDVRTAAEIADSYRSDLPNDEGNLIANWRFDDLSSEMVTTNSVSGNDLLVRAVVAPGTFTVIPTLELRLDENSVTGTVVGQIQGLDVEREARISALLAADTSLRYNAETNKFYKLINSTSTWSAAQSNAIATTLSGIAGELFTVGSASENALGLSFAQSMGDDIWLGLSDTVSEGVWRWYSGSSATSQAWQGTSAGYALNDNYVNWASGQPNDTGGVEDFAFLQLADGLWNDHDSVSVQRSVVQWNADDVLDATQALTYTITSQTVAGAFAINSDTGVITVANGNLLNFEAQTSHTITVRTTDGSGATFDRNYTVALNNLTEENNAPSDLSSGINLNTDGGNNAYLMSSSGGSVFGGRTSLTLEVSYAMSSNALSENPLVSYAVAGADNEIFLRISPTGALMFTVNNAAVVSSPAFAQLIDGKMHAVAVSWDSTAGDVRFYVDGQLVHTTTGLKAGTTLQGGGTLVLGQDQDSVNGGYNSAQRFSGTLYDVRVWDRAISDEQISLNYQNVPGSTETGLIANWRMSGISGGTTVVDAVGGVNLTLANVAVGGGFTASTTTAGLSVSENAALGTRVGQLIATDPDISRDIVLDGLFREAANPGTSTNYTSGSSIGNWTVSSGNVDLVGTSFQSSPLGGRSIDLNGTSAGAISQTLSTAVGKQYQVLFNVSGNWSSGETTKDFRVAAGGVSQDYSLSQPTGWSTSNMLWSGRSMTFTAASTSTVLDFVSLDTGSGATGAVIADVRVIEIPQAVQVLLSNDSSLTYDAATGKFYRAVSANVNWSSALSAATSTSLNGVNGQLVTIGSHYENDLVWSLARSLNNNVWLGATDTVTEGTWRWYSGTNASTTFWVGTSGGTLQSGQYANWNAGEPNDSGGTEEFGHMWVANGLWNDWTSTATMAYVVEWDANEVLSNFSYSITSDPSGAFTINTNTGEITVGNATPLNEIATDPSITVQVTGAAGNSTSETFTITINRVNDNTPVITSNGGGTTASVNVAEGATSVTTVTATDADLPAPTLTYSIVGGADAAFFSIGSSSGALSFVAGRNFESPADAGANNVYDVVVRASDGSFTDDQTIAVTITNVNESPTDLVAVPSVSEANVLGYYSFTSANNLGRDDAGDTSPMTLFGTATQITGPTGSGALDLSGGAYGNIASMTTGGAMTLATWVRFDTTSANGFERVIDLGQTTSGGIGNIYIARLGTSNNLTFTIEKNGVYTHRATANNAIVNGTWMHVAGTVDAAGNMTLYVNGVALATTVGVAPDVGVRTGHFVGRSHWSGDGAFDGAIDDLLIANGAMSATSIAQLYQQTSGFSVSENATNGTLVGTILTTDPDAANTYTYSLVDSASGRFAIHSTTGSITVANGSLLNYEASQTHSIVVRSTDQGGLSRDETFTINVGDVNEAPLDLTLGTTPTGLTTAGNASLVSGTTYQLTPAVNNQAGAVWGAVNLAQDFVITSRAFFGAADGADGFAFALQNQGSNVVGGGAASYGVGGLSSAFGIAFDTHFNNFNNEINSDFSQFFRQGQTASQGTAFDTPNAHDNLEDGLWRDLVVTWNATSKTLSYSLDGATIDSIVYDVVVNDWGGNANGWFGFGAGTGGANNQHQVQILSVQTGGVTSIAENAANGSVVGVVSAIDPDRTGTLTYSLIQNQGGAFAINSSTGQITVANSSQLDFDSRATLPIIVRATDQAGLTYDEALTITLTNVNEAPTFSTGSGRNHTSISGMQFGNAVAQQADGKYVMAGWSDAAGTRDFAVIRYNFDGSLDTTFGGGNGYVITEVGTSSDEAQDIRILANGKILVQGYAINGGSNDIAFVQYNSDGSLDTSFGGGTGKVMSGIAGDDTGYSMDIQSDGKIVVGGVSGNDFLVARFNSDGTLDGSFGTAGRVTTDFAGNSDTGQAIAIQADGKILLAGRAFQSGTFTDFAVARYNSNGSLDTSFNGTGRVTVDFGSSTDQAYGLAIQSDGKIVVNGFTNAAGTTDNGVIRLTASGALDTTFNTTGRVITSIGSGSDFAFDLKIQSDGKILSSGYASASGNDFTVVRYNTDGSLDTSYGSGGIALTNFNATTDDRGAKMFLQADGRVILAGCTTQSGTYDLALARYNADGTADLTFNASNTLGGSIAYTENGAGVVMDNNVSVFDAELTNANFSGATLTLVRSGGANSQDVFSASGTLSALTQGANLVVGGTTIGTVTTNSNGTLQLTFNGNATRTLVESAMRQIAYSNNSDAPSSSVQVNWTFNDGNTGAQGSGGALTATGSVTVNITAVNDAPVIAGLNGDVRAYTEGSPAVLIGSATGITDPDSSDFNNGTLTVAFIAGSDSTEDVLGIRNEGSSAGQIGVSGSNVTFGGVTIGTWTGGSNGVNLSIALNANANATNTAALINNLTYLNTDNDNPTTTTRTIRVVLTDGDGGTSLNNDTTLTVAAVNDAPTAVVDSATAGEAGGTSNGTAGTNPSGNVLTNDTDVDTGDTKTVSGVAAGIVGSASSNVGSSVTGTYGSINIAANGAYTYTVDNANASVQALRTSSQTLSDVFTYTMVDSGGATSTTQITITIQGANDAPTDIAIVGNSGTNLVTNGSFETNNGSANSASFGASVTVSGWTAIGGEGFEVWKNFTNNGPAAASDGISLLELDVGVGLNGISQDITTAAGQKYVLSFDFSGRSTAASSSIEVYWQNSLIGTISQPAVGWNTYSFIVTGSGGADNLRFMELASENNGFGSLLDNVRVVADQSNSVTIAENSANGTVVARAGSRDLDTGSPDTVTYSLTNNAGGRFAINATTGVITVADGSLLNFETNTSHTIIIRATDSLNATLDRTFVIGVTNANEAPNAVSDTATATEAGGISNGTAGTNPTGNVLTNDTDVDAGDTKTVTGVVAGVQASAAANVGSNVTGTYGSINIAANGAYTYTVDNNNATVQALRTSGQTITDVFTYTMTDAAGATSTTQITVTIQGANDAPTAVADTATAVEAGGTSNGIAGTNPTGNVLTNDTDPDSAGNGETKTVSGVAAGTVASASGSVAANVTGTYGSITIAANGAYTYTVDNNNATVQALRTSGQTITDVSLTR